MSNNESGKQFYSALQAKAMSAVKDIFKSELYPIQYPSQGDFMWNYQNINQVFNQGTFKYISANVSPGEVDGTAKLSDEGGFPNAYVQVINAIAYTLSKANQDKLNKAQSAASTQAQSIVSDYQNTFGTITDQQMKDVSVATKYDYVISYILGSIWSGKGTSQPLTYTDMQNARNLRKLLPKMPASGDQVVTDVSAYLNLMKPVLALQDLMQNGSWMITQLKNNTTYPDDSNGGMKTFDPNTGAISANDQVGYSINTSLAAITNDLQNTGRSISLGMTTSQASGDSISVHIEGQAGFSIGSWLKFSVGASTEYDMSKVNGTSTNCSVTMTWSGYSMVPMSPTAWQQATNVGWYYADIIAQAVKNGNNDVDGFKFEGNPPPYNMGAFKNGGNFGMLTNMLISNYPTIEITYQNANFSSFKQSWSEKVSGNLTLFGFIKLGSFSQGAYGSSYQQGSDNSTFTVKFSASPEIISVPQNQKTAYVIGGAVTNPGVAL